MTVLNMSEFATSGMTAHPSNQRAQDIRPEGEWMDIGGFFARPVRLGDLHFQYTEWRTDEGSGIFPGHIDVLQESRSRGVAYPTGRSGGRP